MNNKLVEELINFNKNIVIPNYVIKYYKELDIEGLSFIFMMYLINQKDIIVFDINKIAEDLNQEAGTILDLVNELNEKNYISIKMKKTNGVIEEYISTDLFFSKISSLIMDDKEESNSSTIFDIFEQEFGRTLSPTECETINNWLESKLSEDLIKAALKEAVLNGVHNLRYIDKILFEWNKKGYKEPIDIKNKISKDDDYIEELYDYDWINEN